MRLAEYLKNEGLSRSAFARDIGVKPGTVWRYCLVREHPDHRIPTPAIMTRIVKATGGEVQPGDFYDLGPADESPAAHAAAAAAR